MLQIVDCTPAIAQEMYDHFSFYVPGYKFMPAFKRRQWDGQIHMLNRMNGEIAAGLYDKIRVFAGQRGYGIEVEKSDYGYPYDKNEINHLKTVMWTATLGLPFTPRDYQYDAFTHAIQNKRCVLISPTGSGKSLIIYMTVRWVLERTSGKVLIIVPTTGLVEQMYKDFEDYGFDSNSECHKIYSGKDKDTDKRVVITTWQSVHRLQAKWFKQFDSVFGDEVHGFKAKSLSSIMNKATEAKYRFGTTGTLDGSEVNELVIEGLFGPIHQVTTTKQLQDNETLAKLNIDVVVLKYREETCENLKDATYQEEIDFLVSCDARNKFLRNLACSLDGNTLVLFNLVEKHGKTLRDLIESKLEEGRRLFYVSGETKTSDRESIRSIVEKQTNCVVLASLGTFSTGINIRNIHNIIFASPSKSQIRVLQSIGRGLRVSDDGRSTKLYDIADDLHYKSHKNFTLLHSGERIKIYNKEKFPYRLIPVII